MPYTLSLLLSDAVALSEEPDIGARASPPPSATVLPSLPKSGRLGDSGLTTRRGDAIGPGGLPDPAYRSFNDFKKDYERFKNENGEGTLLIFTRHTESLFNRVGDFMNGDNDSPLIADGVKQAEELAATLDGFPVSTIITSPLARAYDMAELLRIRLGVANRVQANPDLSEMERGALSGRPKKLKSAQIDALFAQFDDPAFRDAFRIKYGLTEEETDHVFATCRLRRQELQALAQKAGLSEDDYVAQVTACENTMDCEPPGGGESFRHAEERMRLVAELFLGQLDSGNYLLVGHGMTQRLLYLKLLGIPVQTQEQLYAINQGYGSINVLWRKAGSDEWTLLVFNSDRAGN